MQGLFTSLAVVFDDFGQPERFEAWRKEVDSLKGIQSVSADISGLFCELLFDLLSVAKMPDGHVLLVIDQLEEVFGTQNDSEARSMLRLLLEASELGSSPLVTLSTMRSDYLNDFQLFPGAANRYDEVTIDPMPKPRFGELIRRPAERFGLRIDPGLTERLVEDTQFDDALPLLAFTLEKLYEGSDDKSLISLKQYEDVFPDVTVRSSDGTLESHRGVSAAIKFVADAILRDSGYDKLQANDRILRDLRRAFFSLARIGVDGSLTRREATWSQMPPSCKDVLQSFVDQRLLISDSDGAQSTLSVAHEALFRVWDRLSDWLVQDRKALVLRAQIEEAASQWAAEERADSRLWPEDRVMDAISTIAKSGVSLDDVGDRATVSAFLGPTSTKDLLSLLARDEVDDSDWGSGRFGGRWRLPLGHEARMSVGVRLAILGDPRHGVGVWMIYLISIGVKSTVAR